MIALALPLLAATGLVPDREPGAPWIRFPTAQGPVYIDPTSVRDEGGEKVIRALDTAETPATSDIYIDLSIDCAQRRGVMIRLTDVKTGKTHEIPPDERKPADPGHPFMLRIIGFVCEGKPLQ